MSDYTDFKYVDRIRLSQRIYRFAWNIVYWFFYRFTPSFILHRWRVFLLRLFGAHIGVCCKIASSSRVWLPYNLVLGDYVALDANVFILA